MISILFLIFFTPIIFNFVDDPTGSTVDVWFKLIDFAVAFVPRQKNNVNTAKIVSSFFIHPP